MSVTGVAMRRADIAFLISVALMAVVFLLPTLSRFTSVLTRESGSGVVLTPAGGTPRDVDMKKLRQLLRARRLSDHEALFYQRRSTSQASDGE